MGKRSNFERKPRDYYRTPIDAVKPLFPFIQDVQNFCEPCAGDGALIRSLTQIGLQCVSAYDIEPQSYDIRTLDAFAITEKHLKNADVIITNPPWDRKILHPLIDHLSALRPTWLLFDADWAHTRQSTQFLPKLRKIVSVGRVKWFDNTSGKDNAAWYLFDNQPDPNPTKFYGRA